MGPVWQDAGVLLWRQKKKNEEEMSTEMGEKRKTQSRQSHLDTGPQTPEAYASLVSLVMAF